MYTGDDFNIGDFGDFAVPAMDSSLKMPLCLVLDRSASMRVVTTDGAMRINELNRNVRELLKFIKTDPKASKICDIAIVSFGDVKPTVEVQYSSIDDVYFQDLKASGRTPMGQAVEKAIDMLQDRREYYKEHGIEHYKPIMMLMTDGLPTDEYKAAAERCSSMVNKKQLKIYPVGIGNDFNNEILAKFSPLVKPKQIVDMKGFMKLFELLSRSSSNPADDSIDKWFNDEF